MTDQNTAPSFDDTLRHLAGSTAQLDKALTQMLEVLRKRGLQFSVDLSVIVREVANDVNVLEQVNRGQSQRLRLYEQLVRTSTLINSSLDLNQVLEDVIDTIISLTGAERAYLLLRDKETGKLRTQTARNGDRETLAEDDTVFSRSVINTAIEQRSPVLTTNAQTDERFQAVASVMNYSLRSIICIPIVLQDQVIGLLYADNRIGEGVFTQDNVPILVAFANQSAIAIENARLFGRVKSDLAQARKEVEQLRVQIDQSKLEKQLSEVMETDFFAHVQQLGQNARRRNAERRAESETPSETK
jgi:GAF domain-containing protein